jgi:hypothetical protein
VATPRAFREVAPSRQRFILIAQGVLACGCDNVTKIASKTAALLARVDAECSRSSWNTRDFDRFADLMADGAILHIDGGDVPCDPAGTRAIAEEWTMAFPDWCVHERGMACSVAIVRAGSSGGGVGEGRLTKAARPSSLTIGEYPGAAREPVAGWLTATTRLHQRPAQGGSAILR